MEKELKPLYQAFEECCLEHCVDVYGDRELQAAAVFMFSKDFSGFAGHFPGRPVVPAIVQLALIRYLAECATGCPLIPVCYQQTKFRAIIQPDEKVKATINCTRKGIKSNWYGSFTLLRLNNELIATGSVEYSI